MANLENFEMTLRAISGLVDKDFSKTFAKTNTTNQKKIPVVLQTRFFWKFPSESLTQSFNRMWSHAQGAKPMFVLGPDSEHVLRVRGQFADCDRISFGGCNSY